MVSHVVAERSDLRDTLAEVGPDCPTLCTGWDTRTLLAHMILRERSVIELATRLRLPRASVAAEKALADFTARHSYAAMLAAFDHGAPLWSPLALGPAREVFNLLEYVVHHEDVRRVDPSVQPRDLPADRQRAIFERLRGFARVTMRSAPDPVRLQWSHRTIDIGRGPKTVTVKGDPLELALFAYGRQAVAVVEYTGDPAAIRRMQGARLGIA